MADTFTTLWNRLLLRANVDPALAQDLVRDAFNQLAERRKWSWLQKSACWYPPSITVAGTVSLTPNSATVTGVGTNFDASWVGAQFRLDNTYPTYTIIAVQSATSMTLDAPWVGATLAGKTYTVFQCYFTTPADFQASYLLTNPTNSYRLWTDVTQFDLGGCDPQRASSGPAYAASF